MFTDYLTFIRELPRSFAEIGAMLPSSKYLGREMVRPIRQAQRPLKILEVGPGTGPFTRQILQLMGPQDEFIVCEINARFLNRLKKGLEQSPYYRANSGRVSFYQGSVFDLERIYEPSTFDVIVSSLPLANFSPEMVESIFNLFDTLIAPGGSVTFFEYAGLRKIGTPFRSASGCARVRAVDEVVRRWCDHVSESGEVRRKLALLNLPPAISIELTV